MMDRTRKQILDLALDRVPPQEIRARIKPALPITQIYGVIRTARTKGIVIPAFPRSASGTMRNNRSIAIPAKTFEAFRRSADARRMPISTLIAHMLTQIAHSDLVEAILDDGEN